MKTSSAKIFLGEQHGTFDSSFYSRRYTFNFGNFFSEHRQQFGPLYLFNDEILGGGTKIEMEVEDTSYVVIIPITGELIFTDMDAGKVNVNVGQVLVSKLSTDTIFSVSNPYQGDAINFMQFFIKTPAPITPMVKLFDFDIAKSTNINTMITDTHLPFSVSINRFNGREETTYTMKPAEKGIFCFAIAGAFEIEGRLLHPKDGLALWNTDEVEIEALSNNALLLLLPLSYTPGE